LAAGYTLISVKHTSAAARLWDKLSRDYCLSFAENMLGETVKLLGPTPYERASTSHLTGDLFLREASLSKDQQWFSSLQKSDDEATLATWQYLCRQEEEAWQAARTAERRWAATLHDSSYLYIIDQPTNFNHSVLINDLQNFT
jgi:hypothetical protein